MKKLLVFLLLLSCVKFASSQEFVLSDTISVYDVVETPPSFPGGEKAMKKYISDNIVFPEQAKDEKNQKTVVIKFIIDPTGKVINPEVIRKVNPQLDAEALRLVSSMPNWIPAKQGGKNVYIKYYVPVDFKMINNKLISKQDINENTEDKIFDVVDVAPSFPGGMQGLMSYISHNVRYPVKAQEFGVEGRIVVQFVIDTDGEIINVNPINYTFNVLEPEGILSKKKRTFKSKEAEIKYLEEIEDAKRQLVAEALRVVKVMPNWIPGIQKDKPVKCKFYVPINFKLR